MRFSCSSILGSLLVTLVPIAAAIPLLENHAAEVTAFPSTQSLLGRDTTLTISPSPTAPPTNTAEYYLSTQLVTIPGFTNDHATKEAQTITIAIPTCSKTITPDKNGYVPPGSCGALYRYYPSFAAALAASVAFGVLTIAHTVLAVKYKTTFCWVIIMACLWETIGFATRTASTKQQQSHGLVLISQIMILLVPLWVNAYIYVLLSHLIHYVHPLQSVARIPASLLAIMFVLLDFITFIVQLIGGMTATPMSSHEEQMKGIHIYMGGIGIQQFFILIFLGLAIRFQWEMNRFEKLGGTLGVRANSNGQSWRQLLWAVYAGLGFITIRIIYRLIEFSGGRDQASNPLPFKEIYIYVLEALPMLLAILTYVIIHPGRYLDSSVKMPGVWSTVKGCCTGRKRAKRGTNIGMEKLRGDSLSDSEELVSGYNMVDGRSNRLSA